MLNRLLYSSIVIYYFTGIFLVRASESDDATFSSDNTVVDPLSDITQPDQFRLVHDKLQNYDSKVKPTYDNNKPIKVNFSMDLYQLLELNEPQQYVLLNVWIIERWYDEFLYWDPKLYNNITEIRLPYNAIWLPDTTLYNSLVMKDEDQRRLLNAKLVTIPSLNTTYIEMLYPAIFKFSCLLNLRYFPYDVQRCRMIFSSWTYDKAGIDYFPHYDQIGNKSYIENEAWGLLLTLVQRVEKKFPCCPVNYTLLHYDIFLRRKPLFYFINLIIPTSIITFIALVGFFSTSSTSGMREEKVSLGITTLLSMSILMLMVSDQMPTTSTFIPLIGWFILGMIIIISFGTLASTFVIAVQKRGRMGVRLSRNALRITMLFSIIAFIKVPKHLEENKTKKSKCMERYSKTAAKVTSNFLATSKKIKNHWFSFNSKDACSLNNRVTSRRPSSVSTTQQSFIPSIIGTVQQSIDETPILDQSNKTNSPQLPLAVAEDDTSSSIGEITEAEAEDTSEVQACNNTKQRVSVDQIQLAQGIHAFSANLKQNRKYAEVEYEWLATVLEFYFFCIFVVLFLIIAVGINALGYYNWKIAEFLVHENIDCTSKLLNFRFRS